MNLKASAAAFVRHHRTAVVVAAIAIIALLIDQFFAGAAMRQMVVRGWTGVRTWFGELSEPEPWLALVALTLFLAFANLYLKIALQAPKLQRRLRPPVFFNMPFAIYCSVYLLISVMAFTLLRGTAGNDFVAVVSASLIGIGLGNADVKFGGFSLLPISEFLQGLEGVVQAGIGVELSELDVAKRARLRDDLASTVPLAALERECRFLGVTAETFANILDISGDDEATAAGLLAREIVARSEANARRIIDDWLRRT